MQKPRFQGTTKATEFPEMQKRRTTTERPTTTTEQHETTTERHTTATERAPSSTSTTKATEVPPNRECTPKVSYVQASQVPTHAKRPTRSFHISRKAPSKFHNDPQTEVFTRPNKPFKFPYPPKSTPKFHKCPKPRFPPTQNDLSKFHQGKKVQRFPYIHNHHPEPTPKIANSRFLNVQ